MKRGIIIIGALCAVCVAQAQDKQAKTWLDKSALAFTASGALSADFSLSAIMSAQQGPLNFEGTIDLKGAKYHLNVPEMETWFDGKTQWVLQKADGEVSISEPDVKEVQQLNPAIIFEMYKKGCNYTYLGEKTDAKGKKVHEVELISQDKKNDLSKIILQINATDAMPTKMHVFFSDKYENIIQINKYRKNLALPDSFFSFDPKKYPNVDVIDLR
ncbi:membrane protein [Bacteroidia bacterium]|nr:membrane protein [Bacteroidia bacterium]